MLQFLEEFVVLLVVIGRIGGQREQAAQRIGGVIPAFGGLMEPVLIAGCAQSRQQHPAGLERAHHLGYHQGQVFGRIVLQR